MSTTPEPAQALKRKRNPGRNLPAAFATGIVLGGFILLIVLGVPALTDNTLIIQLVWSVVAAIMVGLGLHEVLTHLKAHGYRLPPVVMHIMAQAIVWSALAGITGIMVAFLLSIMLFSVIRLFLDGNKASPTGWLRDTSMGGFLLAWIPLMGAFTTVLMGFESADGTLKGNLLLVTFIVTVVCSDTGGYTFGVLWGKHPLAPKVSPKKSWEGLTGSLVFALIAAILMTVFLLKLPWWVGIVLAVGLVFSDIFGDLAESQVKRELGIKDMSNLLPGHGGMMDRVDGMLPSAAMTWVVLTIAVSLNGLF